MENIIKQFMDEMDNLEKWHQQEYKYCRNSGWDTFSRAKGEYRWVRKYIKNIRSKCSNCYDDPEKFFSTAIDLINETNWDYDYPEPLSIKKKINKRIESYYVL